MRTATVVAAVMIAAGALPVAGQQPGATAGGAAAPAPGRAAVAATAQLVATVEAIDAAARTVVLKGPKGSVQTLRVSDEVRNLPQLKVGDRVLVTYAQALALQLKKGGPTPRERVGREGSAGAVPAARPSGAIGREVTVVADVVAVNYVKQTVTLRGSDQTVTLAVPDTVDLRSITSGDQVHAIYTEAFAVAVRMAP